MESLRRNFFYWIKINVFVILLITIITLLLVFIIDFFLIGITSIYLSVSICVFLVASLFYIKKKFKGSVLFLTTWISFLAFTGSILLPVILEPQMCSGGFYIVPYRILIIVILVLLILLSLVIGFQNKLSFIIVGLCSFLHFLCITYILPFNYAMYVVNLIWKQFI